jgi:hypothetical protein
MTHEGRPIDHTGYIISPEYSQDTDRMDVSSIAHIYAGYLWNLDSQDHDKEHYSMSDDYRQNALETLESMDRTISQLDDPNYIQAFLHIKAEIERLEAGAHRQFGHERQESHIEYPAGAKLYNYDGEQVEL